MPRSNKRLKSGNSVIAAVVTLIVCLFVDYAAWFIFFPLIGFWTILAIIFLLAVEIIGIARMI